MGVESFGISMRFVEHAVAVQIEDMLQDYPHIKLCDEETVAGFQILEYVYNDGSHFIEFQLANEMANDECILAVRFSLCSYSSIDSIFVEIVRYILSAHEAEVWLMCSAIKQTNQYLPGELTWLTCALPDEIISMREYWQSLFGGRQGAVRVKDSFSFVRLK